MRDRRAARRSRAAVTEEITVRHPTVAAQESHLDHRSNWLRAAVLGANDGILSTASLVLGIAGAGASGSAIVTTGTAELVAGALSMAAGEFVSVSSQRDTEEADLRLEQRELRTVRAQARALPLPLQHRGALRQRDARAARREVMAPCPGRSCGLPAVAGANGQGMSTARAGEAAGTSLMWMPPQTVGPPGRVGPQLACEGLRDIVSARVKA